jgi:hypothetical protein
VTSIRLLVAAIAAAVAIGGCYSFAEPSFHPGNQRDIVQAVLQRGVITSEPEAGRVACADPSLVDNALYFTARMPDETEPRDVYIYLFREKSWDGSAAAVDACQAAYAADHPGSTITRLDIPVYRAFGADWSAELTDALTRALEQAANAGAVIGQ